MHQPSSADIRERGRRAESIGTVAYFEVLAVRDPGVSKFEVFALDDLGKVIGSGVEYRPEGCSPGMIFEVRILNISPTWIAHWIIQTSGFNTAIRATTVEALTRYALAYEGGPVDYVEPPSTMTPTPRKLPPLKGRYAGQVISSARSNSFHRPDCRSARAFHPDNRRVFGTPAEAWDAGLFPCFTCLL